MRQTWNDIVSMEQKDYRTVLTTHACLIWQDVEDVTAEGQLGALLNTPGKHAVKSGCTRRGHWVTETEVSRVSYPSYDSPRGVALIRHPVPGETLRYFI